MCACVRACVRAYVRACVRVCVAMVQCRVSVYARPVSDINVNGV